MPYYHIHLCYRVPFELKNVDYWEFNLSKSMVQNIIKEYSRMETFLFAGKWVDGIDVEEVHIYETKTPIEGYSLTRKDKIDIARKAGKEVIRRFIRTSEAEKVQIKKSKSKRVFIVHGRDHKSMKELKVMLKEFGLKPTVLHEQPSGSRTIVEKLEKYSDVGYAFVILTPDDIGGYRHKLNSKLSKVGVRTIEEYGERAR